MTHEEILKATNQNAIVDNVLLVLHAIRLHKNTAYNEQVKTAIERLQTLRIKVTK